MKKTAFLSVVMAFLFISSMNAQSKKSEVDLGVGIWSSNQIIGTMSDIIASAILPAGVSMDNSSYIGALHVGYKYSLSDRFALGPVLTYDLGTSDAVANKEKTGKFTSNYYSLSLEADYKFINRDKFKLYALVGAGGTILNQVYKDNKTGEKNGESQTFFNFQITPVGIKYGDSFGVFAELGLGYKGILCAGVFYRF
jgi:opacity protein-like surface antigen